MSGIGLGVAFLWALTTPVNGAAWRVEVQFLEKPLAGRAEVDFEARALLQERGLLGKANPLESYRTKGALAVVARPGQRFEAEATFGGATWTVSGTMEAQADGTHSLDVDACWRLDRGSSYRTHDTVTFDPVGQGKGLAPGQRMLLYAGSEYSEDGKGNVQAKVGRGLALAVKEVR